MQLNKYMSQRKFGVLIIIVGIVAIALAILISPSVATQYLSPDHYITPDGIKLVNIYRFILSLGGIIAIIGGLILAKMRNLCEKEQPMLSFLRKLYEMRFGKTSANVFLVIVIGVYIFLFVVVSANIRNAFLWFDESGQFWISKGLNHYSCISHDIG